MSILKSAKSKVPNYISIFITWIFFPGKVLYITLTIFSISNTKSFSFSSFSLSIRDEIKFRIICHYLSRRCPFLLKKKKKRHLLGIWFLEIIKTSLADDTCYRPRTTYVWNFVSLLWTPLAVLWHPVIVTQR